VQIDADAAPTYFAYDALGRQTTVTDALGSSSYYEYDAAGRQTAQVDALGYVTYLYYDVLGRQEAGLDPAGGVVYYGYDCLGNRASLTDQRGHTSYFDYDRLSRLVSELDPLDNVTYYGYDAGGSLLSRTDGKGQTAYFAYDAAGRQIAAKYPLVEPVYFEYDLSGNRTAMLDEWGATYWSYDALGRPLSRQDARGTTVYYAYGPGGERTELTVLGQGTVYYEHDPVGNMSLVLDGKTDSATYYEYDGSRRVTVQRHPNATTTYFSYDLAGRLSEKVTKKDADASVLVRFAYTRDAEGNPIAIERESGLGVFYYEYDVMQRLAYEGQFVGATRQYENYYEYDVAGNRTLLRHGETGAENLTYYDYDAANELTRLHDKDGWTYFAYDANGNTVMEQTPSWTRYYDWDGRDMLTGVRSTEDGWVDNVYRYDGLGARVSTLESTGLTYYDWDRGSVAQERDAGGTVTSRHVYGPASLAVDGVLGVLPTRRPATVELPGEEYSLVMDESGTCWDLVGADGTLANSYAYTGFGVRTSLLEAEPFHYGFLGGRLSPDSGLNLCYLGNYNPELGVNVGVQVPGLGELRRLIDRLRRDLGLPDSIRACAWEPEGLPPEPAGKDCADPFSPCPKPGYVPEKNGCGPGDWRRALVPNRPLWVIDFREPCDTHDVCYGTCAGAGKNDCDTDFLSDMQVKCWREYGWLIHNFDGRKSAKQIQDELLMEFCCLLGIAYFYAVSKHGADVYDRAQAAACDCCCVGSFERPPGPIVV
jgi:YD repeat-containing protein